MRPGREGWSRITKDSVWDNQVWSLLLEVLGSADM